MNYHKLLERQLKRYLVSPLVPEEYQKLFQVISDAYVHFDEDRMLIERSLELSSKELTEYNNKLRHASQELLKAQQMAHIGNWEWDVIANRVTWSDELCRIFGKTAQDYPRTYEAYFELVYPEDREIAQRIVQNAIGDKKPFQFEHRVQLADSTIRHVFELGEVDCDTEGKPIRMHGTAQDITDRKKAEEKLNVRTTELERMNAVMIGRELKMIELKKEIEELKKKVVQP